MRIQSPREVSDSGSSPFPAYDLVHLRFNPPFEHSCNLLSHNWESSDYFLDNSCPSSRSSVGSSPPASPSLSDASISEFDTSTPYLNPEQHYLSEAQRKNRMPKKHASLQSIFIPPFLSSPIPSLSDTPSLTTRPSTRVRTLSSSSRPSRITPSFIRSSEAAVSVPSSPPPDFLLDDDPFANYTGASPLRPHYGTSTSPRHSRKTSVKQPRSPLGAEPCPVISPSPSSSSSLSTSSSPSASSTAEISHPAPLASGRQLRPAYTRPAFAPRPSHPSLHTLAQSDFIYSVKTRKGTLGARLPLEPWDVSAGQDVVLEQVPSILGPEHTTGLPQISEFPPVPESLVVVNEDIHTGDSPDVTADAFKHEDIHILDSEATFIQSPISLEPGPEDGSHMSSPLFEALSGLSPPTLSRSSSSSSTSSVPALSPDFQMQSPARSPNRSSSEESASVDLSSDDDIIYSLSEALEPGIRDSQSLDLFAMSESLSGADSFQPGTSAGTIRPLVNSIVSACVSPPFDEDWTITLEGYVTPEFDEAEMFDEYAENFGGAVDGDDQEDHSRRTTKGYEGHQTSNEHRGGGRNSGQVNGGDSNGNGRGLAGGNHGGGGRDDRREDERDWRATSAFSTPSDTESEDSEEDSLDPSAQRSEEFSTSGDDNIPLAQRIPTALRAQQTIRKKVREEKDERRRQRALKRQQQQQQQQEIHNQKLLGEEHHAQRAPGLAQTSNLSVASSSRMTRLRTKTLPSNTSRPVVAKDLARRLRDLQDLTVSPPPFVNKQPLPTSDSAPPPGQITQRSEGDAWIPSVGAQDKTLRPMRSFHRPSTTVSAQAQPLPLPPRPHDTKLSRRATSASRPVGRHDHSETSARATSGSLSKPSRRPRTSDGGYQSSTNSVHSPALEHVSLPHISTNVPDPSPVLSAVLRETKQVSWQQRIFIMDLQRFNTVVMNPITTARDVIDVLEAQGQLTAGRADVGRWMLFEVFQDFGMERPIRNFEVVSEVINSWDKDKSVNVLVAKITPLAVLLHPSVMPSSSPVFSSYVEWESKPRKWSKRWLELREQGLWLSKKDNGKDEIFLCSLANFDVYAVTRTHKPPKPYVFAAKSTDSLSFFENAGDYVHVFCCSEKDGKKWLENILLARSYFINQERNTLSVGASTSGGASGKSITRSGTRKGSRSAQQPLVNVSPSTTAASTTSQPYAFEPGSLLSKR